MRCPRCSQNTPDAWKRLVVQDGLEPPIGVKFELETPGLAHPTRVQFDWMHCANEDCAQLVVRAHQSFTAYIGGLPHASTDTWIVYPRHTSRPLDPVVLAAVPELAADYAEAVAILDTSPRMSAVLARSILADLLETYADLSDFHLTDRVDKFVNDQNRPYDVRKPLHYLREIANFGAHTKTDQTSDQLEKIKITGDEAEWTLVVLDRLFDYFIVSPAKTEVLTKGIDA